MRWRELTALALLASGAHAADFDAWREALIAGDPKTIAAMTAADRGRLPVDADGVTVLHKALHIYSAHRIEIVQQLIASGADVNATAEDGRTPLHWACAFDVPPAVALLLRAGAKVDARNEDGDTPLFAASPIGAPVTCPRRSGLEFLWRQGRDRSTSRGRAARRRASTTTTTTSR